MSSMLEMCVGAAGLLYQGMYAQNLVGAQVEMRSFEVPTPAPASFMCLLIFPIQHWQLSCACHIFSLYACTGLHNFSQLYQHDRHAWVIYENAALVGMQELVAAKLPKLGAHLKRLNCDMTLIATDWFLCLFSTVLPSEVSSSCCLV